MKTDLIYGVEDRPPFKDALFAALQHLLAIFVAIITPPLIIAGALKLDLETTGFLVSMALFASGVSTFIQCRRVGPVGCGLLCIQGTSFSFHFLIFLYSLTLIPADYFVLLTPTILNICDTAPYPHLFPVLHTLVHGTACRSLLRLP